MRPEDIPPPTFDEPTPDEEERLDLRRVLIRHAVKVAVAFAALFFLVFLALSWSGATVRFAASRVGDRGTPTWTVAGTVRNAATRAPIPWAAIDDDRRGQPPFFHADAGRAGEFELLTLSESHRIVVTAPGYRPSTIRVGRIWFLWMPRGSERRDVDLSPE
ncbi:MAG TPA: hypothetical protein VGH38_30960 [Bryobacteraceae bacterium]